MKTARMKKFLRTPITADFADAAFATALLVMFAVTVVIVGIPGAIATHLQEPTDPITGGYLQVLHYQNPQYIVPCHETSMSNPYPYPFVGARIRAFIGGPRPSEHFKIRMTENLVLFGPQGGFQGFEQQWAANWQHSNIPPHATFTPPGTPWGEMWLHTGDFTNTWYREPGIYRQTLRVEGDHSDFDFTLECWVEVPEGAAS
jgi:hypothetical protein